MLDGLYSMLSAWGDVEYSEEQGIELPVYLSCIVSSHGS